jgi:hypothetical protein
VAKRKKDEPNIVAAVASASGSGATGKKSNLARRLDRAMVEVVEQALAEGVSVYDTDEILARKAAARELIVAEDAAED